MPIRVRLVRGGVPESEHLAEGVIVDRMGTVLAATERPDWTTFFRSSAKPFQLLPLVERGHADRLGLTDRHLALMSASHNGAKIHVEGSREILAATGCDESELECGYHLPEDPESQRFLATADASVKTAIWNNCSGKHAGMIALAKAEGWSVRGYVGPEHPVQKLLMETVADVCGVDVTRMPLATDGCSAVNPALPLVAMARGYARMAAARRQGGDGRESSLARIRDAMAAYPEMVAGEGRFCTALMRVTQGRLVTKTGAEGLQCVAIPSLGYGIAVRVKDGARRATAPALVSWLASLGLLSEAEAERLAEFARPSLANHRGLHVATMDASELPGWRAAGRPGVDAPAAVTASQGDRVTTPRAFVSLVALAALAALASAGLVARADDARADGGRVGPKLARVIAERPADEVVAWVTFTDRAGEERRPGALAALEEHWSPRSLERRRMRGTRTRLDASDLPVHAAYVEALIALGGRVRGTSRWLNAASVVMPARTLERVARLPFVSEVELVPVAPRTKGPEIDAASREAAEDTRLDAIAPAPVVLAVPGQQAWYGPTWKQQSLIGAPALHAAGWSGAGVIVCMLDSGFRLTHEVFAGTTVVAQRDFIHLDSIVDDEPGIDDTGEASHGTMTTAAVVGRKDGAYAGIAFGASVALARTEDVTNGGVATETPAEMDYWQFAAEWADSLGADVINSSLGYHDFDAPYSDYAYADLDGKTTVVARAAEEAARRGITVVVSAGNEGGSAWHFIASPADADTVITVGAVDSLGALAAYSSRGPTADGRIKPDVLAMGSSCWVPRFTANNTYQRVSGTSLASPLVAGMAALLLQAHPGWGPFEVREALRQTAANSGAPNNNLGWGLVQGQSAMSWVPSTTGVDPGTGSGGAGTIALAAAPNPARRGSSVTVRLSAAAGDAVTLDAFDARGRRVARLFEGETEGSRSVAWNGEDAEGRAVPAGIYWLRLASRHVATETTIRIVLLP